MVSPEALVSGVYFLPSLLCCLPSSFSLITFFLFCLLSFIFWKESGLVSQASLKLVTSASPRAEVIGVLLHLTLFSSVSTKVLFSHYGWKSATLFACCLFLRGHKAD